MAKYFRITVGTITGYITLDKGATVQALQEIQWFEPGTDPTKVRPIKGNPLDIDMVEPPDTEEVPCPDCGKNHDPVARGAEAVLERIARSMGGVVIGRAIVGADDDEDDDKPKEKLNG